ncbi:MAG: hypothetical protein KF683_07635 [Rubrivivax sp.]|nr:hypothetical protein [Rubrivivax sp.]
MDLREHARERRRDSARRQQLAVDRRDERRVAVGDRRVETRAEGRRDRLVRRADRVGGEAGVEDDLREAQAIARSGRPVLVNVWLEKTAFREGSLSM